MYIIIGILSSIAESFVLFYLLRKSFGLKAKRELAFYLAIVLDTGIVLVLNQFIKIAGPALLVSLVYELLASIYIYKGKTPLKIFYLLLYVVSIIVINLVVYSIAIQVGHFSTEDIHDTNYVNCILSVISVMILWMFAYLFLKCFHQKEKIITSRYILPILLIPIISICLLYVLVSYSNMEFFTYKSSMLKYIIILGVFILNVYACYIYSKMEESESNRIKIQLLNQEISYYNSLRESYNRASSMKHDYEKHLNVMNGLLQEEQYEELKAYLTSMSQYMAKYQVQTYTENAIIDCVLSQKSVEAADAGIHMFVVAEKLRDMGLNPMNLCILVGNILDNAIEECKRVMESGIDYAYIRAKLSEDTDIGGLVISVANSSTAPKMENGHYLSKKENSREHGMGLKNIQCAVEEMHGICTFGYEQEVFNFVVRLPLQLEET